MASCSGVRGDPAEPCCLSGHGRIGRSFARDHERAGKDLGSDRFFHRERFAGERRFVDL
jgi:hypothetical protein